MDDSALTKVASAICKRLNRKPPEDEIGGALLPYYELFAIRQFYLTFFTQTEIANETGLGQTDVSRYLKKLQELQLLRYVRRIRYRSLYIVGYGSGTKEFYPLDEPGIFNLLTRISIQPAKPWSQFASDLYSLSVLAKSFRGAVQKNRQYKDAGVGDFLQHCTAAMVKQVEKINVIIKKGLKFKGTPTEIRGLKDALECVLFECRFLTYRKLVEEHFTHDQISKVLSVSSVTDSEVLENVTKQYIEIAGVADSVCNTKSCCINPTVPLTKSSCINALQSLSAEQDPKVERHTLFFYFIYYLAAMLLALTQQNTKNIYIASQGHLTPRKLYHLSGRYATAKRATPLHPGEIDNNFIAKQHQAILNAISKARKHVFAFASARDQQWYDARQLPEWLRQSVERIRLLFKEPEYENIPLQKFFDMMFAAYKYNHRYGPKHLINTPPPLNWFATEDFYTWAQRITYAYSYLKGWKANHPNKVKGLEWFKGHVVNQFRRYMKVDVVAEMGPHLKEYFEYNILQGYRSWHKNKIRVSAETGVEFYADDYVDAQAVFLRDQKWNQVWIEEISGSVAEQRARLHILTVVPKAYVSKEERAKLQQSLGIEVQDGD